MVPGVARSVLRFCACRDVALWKEVARAAPFQSTTESAMKFVPVTVRVKPPPPAVALAGATAGIRHSDRLDSRPGDVCRRDLRLHGIRADEGGGARAVVPLDGGVRSEVPATDGNGEAGGAGHNTGR